jgi:phage terminase large subunit-like protein
MQDFAASASATSAVALQVAAGAQLHPEPDWVVRAADEHCFAWVRKAWQRAASVPGAWFDHAKADAVVVLWPKIFRLTEDRFAGKPFRLNDWQEPIVRLLVGWKAPVEVLDEETGKKRTLYARLFRQLRLWIPRKNGKTEFLSALALLFFLLDGTVAGQGFVFARDEEQARLAFDKMAAMCAMSPGLAKRVTATRKALWCPELRAALRLLSGKAEGKHGRSPTVIFGDEMHEWETVELMNNLRQGTGARLQPIELYASTAGLKSQVVGHQLWEESQSIYEGRVDDPTTLVVIFAAEPEDDWTDEAVIAKANPSLGLSPTIGFIRRELALAKDNPRAEANFRRYHLNQWVEQLVRWLNKRKWDTCTSGPDAWKTAAERMKGRKCFGAADVSKNFDFTALAWWFPPEGNERGPTLITRFWLPKDTIETRSKVEKVGFDKWAAAGAIESIDGGVIDLDFIIKQILADMSAFDVQKFGWDPWNALKLYTDLCKAGVREELFTEVRQGHRSLGAATSDFERRVYSGELDHGGHPVLSWMAGHAAVRFDENMNFVPAKKQSTQNIDGISASVMVDALAMAVAEPSLDDFLANAVMR